MHEDNLRSPQQDTVRAILRVSGPLIAALGLIFLIVGFGSFFSSFGSFEPPRYFWCAFVGIPLLAVGVAISKLGYVGAIFRYVAGETAPVAKDAANYMGEGVQPGIKAIAKAVAEGISEGQKPEPPTP